MSPTSGNKKTIGKTPASQRHLRARKLRFSTGADSSSGNDAPHLRPLLAAQSATSQTVLLSSPYFTVERFQLEEPVVLAAAPGKSSVQVLVCLEGGAVVECEGEPPVTFGRGEAVAIPAALPPVTLRAQGQAELLRLAPVMPVIVVPDAGLAVDMARALVDGGLPVLPGIIRGTRTMLRSNQWFPRWTPLSVQIEEPIKPSGTDFAALVHLRDAVRAVVLAQCGEPDIGELVKPAPSSEPA